MRIFDKEKIRKEKKWGGRRRERGSGRGDGKRGNKIAVKREKGVKKIVREKREKKRKESLLFDCAKLFLLIHK